MKKIIFLILVIAAVNVNAATHIVTTDVNYAQGSIQNLIIDANNYDTIKFAPHITLITLSSPIIIDTMSGMYLTIDGENRVTISGQNNTDDSTSIFFVQGRGPDPTGYTQLCNLTMENSLRCAIVTDGQVSLVISNCIIRNNSTFSKYGTPLPAPLPSAALTVCPNASVFIKNCTFYGNNSQVKGGAINVFDKGKLFVTNSTFYDNSGSHGGAIAIWQTVEDVYLYHCTFYDNKAEFNGGAIYSDNENTFEYIWEEVIVRKEGQRDSIIQTVIDSFWVSDDSTGGYWGYVYEYDTVLVDFSYDTLEYKIVDSTEKFAAGKIYSYNCIYIDNKVGGIVTASNQIEGSEVIAGDLIDDNLYENTTTKTKATIFGLNTFTGRYIIPRAPARTANKLTTSNIIAYQQFDWLGVNATGIISQLAKDQIEHSRPTPGNTTSVTFGSIEVMLVNAIAEEGGNVLPLYTVTVLENTAVTFTATPDNCYRFKNWTDANNDIVSTKNPLEVIVIKDTTLTANFEMLKYIVSVTSNGNGSVTPNGSTEISCESVIKLTATPDVGYRFLNWTDSDGKIIATYTPFEVTLYSDTMLFANFVELEEVLSVTLVTSPTLSGNVYGAGNYAANTSVTLTAIADDCYTFRNWTDIDGKIISTESEFTIILLSDTILNANFDIKQFSISVSAEENGSVDMLPAVLHNCGSVVKITATPDAGYKFYNWKNNANSVVSSVNPLDVTIYSDTFLIATFISEDTKIFSLTLNSTVGGSVTGGDANYIENSIVTITAIADDCYTFTHWSDESGNEISTDKSFTFTLVSDTILTANFTQKQYNITLTTSGGGNVIGEGKYNCGSIQTVTAIADGGSEFINWTDNTGNIISIENSFEITLISDTNLTANFSVGITEIIISNSIKINPNPATESTTLSLELETGANLRIILCDALGQEVVNVYNGFANEGIFSLPINTKHLVKGVYFIKLIIGNESIVEKIVIN